MSGENWWQFVKSTLSILNFPKLKFFIFLWQRNTKSLPHPSEIFFSTTVKICWFSLQKKEIFVLVIMCAQCIHTCICKTCVYHAKLCLLLEKSKIDHEGLVGKGTNGCRIGGWTQSSEVPAVRRQPRYSKTHWLSVKCRSKMLFSSFSYVEYLVREVSRQTNTHQSWETPASLENWCKDERDET